MEARCPRCEEWFGPLANNVMEHIFEDHPDMKLRGYVLNTGLLLVEGGEIILQFREEVSDANPNPT